jgi:sulfatase modifying factor 1
MKSIIFASIGITIISCAGQNNAPPVSHATETQVEDSATESSFAPTSQPIADPRCPSDMKLVEGEYCPEVKQRCLRWLDASKETICAAFAPSECVSAHRTHKAFCIDTYEYPNVKGGLPAVMISWNEAKSSCEAQGKRLCGQTEWTFACEGEDMRPYPYGDGLHRDTSACNIDKVWIDPVFKDKNGKTVMKPLALVDQRARSGEYSACVSPFGVHDMTGNVDESVVNPQGRPYHSAEMGGHWAHGARNRCRPMTVAHNEIFKFYEIGSRCCTNVQE